MLSWSAQAPRHRKALVVFHCSEKDADAVDVAVGPCVRRTGPRGGRLRPLVSPLDQKPGDDLELLASLYTVLTGGQSTEALMALRSEGPGTMARLSPAFAGGLADLGTVSTDVDATLAAQTAVAERWLGAATWPPAMQLGGVRMRVLSFALTCRQAREKGHAAYCWHGPEVPAYGIAHGAGPASYAAYRRSRD